MEIDGIVYSDTTTDSGCQEDQGGSETDASEVIHVVTPNENLTLIAERYGVLILVDFLLVADASACYVGSWY